MYDGWIALAIMLAIAFVGLWLQRRAVRREQERARRRFLNACMTFGYQPQMYELGPHLTAHVKSEPATHFVFWDELGPYTVSSIKEVPPCPTNTRG